MGDSHLRALLLTEGDPAQLTGGYLYHRRMAELAPACGARLEFASLPKWPWPLALAAGPAVAQRIRRAQVDVVVIDSIVAALCSPLWFGRSLDVPAVAMLHQPPGGIDYGPPRRPLQARLDLLTYRRCAGWMVASESLAADLRGRGFPPDRVRVVPPGRDVAPASTSAPDLREGRAAAVLCVANWLARKGILELLEAFAKLPPGLATLHLAGDTCAASSYGRAVAARLRRSDLAGRVVVHGPLSLAAVGQLYAGADLFVLPSWREPYGTVYGEAMAAGRPVVGWDAGNLPFLATHGREGLVVRPGDVAGLSNALVQLCGDEPLRLRMGKLARERAASRPTWQEAAGLFFAGLRELSHG